MKIENITEKEVNTKFGAKKAYSVKADGNWYGAGFKKPGFKVGDEVEFTFSENSYGKQMDAASVRVISSGPAVSSASAAPPPSSGRSYGPPAKVFPVPLLHGDRSIIRQNSVTNAVNTLKIWTDDADNKRVWSTAEELAKSVVTIARIYEEYSAGDVERRAAEGNE